jgi:bifunctional non-homologous end joining protein LigD
LFIVPMSLPHVKPLELARRVERFDDSQWIFELKHDGFRALAYVADGQCRLVSRRGNDYKSFDRLRDAMAHESHAKNAILDGEIVCLDAPGRSQFKELLFRRGNPCFYAFDLLWLNGRDLRQRPLLECKRLLRRLIRRTAKHILYVHHVKTHGRELLNMVCSLDLEGIVAKRKDAPYSQPIRWVKVKNRAYMQIQGRQELFERQGRRRQSMSLT